MHFRTFDHVIYTHDVGCEFFLLKGVTDGGILTPFELIGNFEEGSFTVINRLRLEVGGVAYEVLKNGSLLVDGIDQPTLFENDVIYYSYLPGESSVSLSAFSSLLCSCVMQ